MRALNPMRTRGRTIDDLRLAVACLPRATRLAMLEGIAHNDIIVGAYSNRDGICPMLAAHRAGGRTSFIGFAQAWDRFAERSFAGTRSRRATKRELLILKAHLEASLLDDEAEWGVGLGTAIAEHRALLASRSPVEVASRDAQARKASERQARKSGEWRARRSPKAGDPDRMRELRERPGWAWTRIFRRYDEYEYALRRLEDEVERTAPEPVVAGRPGAD